MIFEPSELIINDDGSIFHLHLKPEDIADTIILVGDPGRVEMVSGFFDRIELKKSNREFHTITGYYNNQKVSVISSGIGTDNIDIVVNELDALANIDLNSRTVKKELKSLNFIRIGTSGSLQEDIPVGSYLISEKAIGFDGLINYYAGKEKICDLDFEKALKKQLSWSNQLTSPYVVNCCHDLANKISGDNTLKGVTISAPGFYGPQGRKLRIPPLDEDLNNKLTNFRYREQRITNYEMESSAIYGLSRHLGHHAVTICAIIANRLQKEYSKDYKRVVKTMIDETLKRLFE